MAEWLKAVVVPARGGSAFGGKTENVHCLCIKKFNEW